MLSLRDMINHEACVFYRAMHPYGMQQLATRYLLTTAGFLIVLAAAGAAGAAIATAGAAGAAATAAATR